MDIRSDFDEEKVFYTLFREQGVSDRERGGVWINLLGAADLKKGHNETFFAKISEIENA